jgi:hypothetical protein
MDASKGNRKGVIHTKDIEDRIAEDGPMLRAGLCALVVVLSPEKGRNPLSKSCE